jgi:hypothetical protein
MEKNITKGYPQGACCRLGFWNIQYNSLLNLKYPTHMKAVAFTDDLVIMITGDFIREAENIANIEFSKISAWAKTKNKIRFNEQKSKVMLMKRRKNLKYTRGI